MTLGYMSLNLENYILLKKFPTFCYVLVYTDVMIPTKKNIFAFICDKGWDLASSIHSDGHGIILVIILKRDKWLFWKAISGIWCKSVKFRYILYIYDASDMWFNFTDVTFWWHI